MDTPKQVNLNIKEQSNNINYESKNIEETKPSKYAGTILFLKSVTSLPFYLVALYEPFYIQEYSWILYMEAFHHFHARIFFLLAIYRGLLQIYFSYFSNGYYQKRFVLLEVTFDCSLIGIYLHENYSLHNIKVFISNFFLFYICNTILSLYSLLLTRRIKIDHIV